MVVEKLETVEELEARSPPRCKQRGGAEPLPGGVAAGAGALDQRDSGDRGAKPAAQVNKLGRRATNTINYGSTLPLAQGIQFG